MELGLILGLKPGKTWKTAEFRRFSKFFKVKFCIFAVFQAFPGFPGFPGHLATLIEIELLNSYKIKNSNEVFHYVLST